MSGIAQTVMCTIIPYMWLSVIPLLTFKDYSVYTFDMKTTIDKIIEEVLSLSPQARAYVAEKLIESLDTEPDITLSSEWRDEIRKRCREIDEGSVELRDAETVFARGYAALG